MREQGATIPLEPEGIHLLYVLRRFERGLRDFVIVYHVKEGDADREIARFDCCHGFAHRDLPYLPITDKRRKAGLPDAPLEEQYGLAMEDIFRNWRRYYLESMGR